MKTDNLQIIIDELKKGKNFAIFLHISPDADAIGSGLALSSMIEKFGGKGYIFCDDEEPDCTKFLLNDFCRNDSIIDKCDTLIYIDQSNLARSGKYYSCIKDNTKKIIVIDHHVSNDEEGYLIYRNPTVSSVAEIIYNMFTLSNTEIDTQTALYLYSGIATDTGCFIHPNTTSSCHAATANLLSKGIDISKANFELFIKRPANYIQIQKYIFGHVQVFGDKLTLICIDKKSYKRLGEPDSYIAIDALSHYTTDILILVTEHEKDVVRINARSRDYDVQKLCAKFGGGGHIHASGANSPFSLKQTISKIKKEILL